MKDKKEVRKEDREGGGRTGLLLQVFLLLRLLFL
jgi:hypothetical protein